MVLFLAAVAHQLSGDFPQAEQMYQRALELAPDAPQIWNNLGNLYRQVCGRRQWW
jgi:Flp pilus assembly protein TadD